MNRPSLQPITLGDVEIRNRIAQSATVNNLGHNLEITEQQIAFYRARAEGGVGMIVTEGLSVHPTSIPNPTAPLAFDERTIPGFRRLVDAVHSHDGAIVGQLWHVGRQALWNPTLVPWAPSGERDLYSGVTPHVMTDAEILDVIDGFATSARNLAEAGFDGVELHGAHGYLITQFLSPLSNRRTDRWGGSLENRSRFAVELIRACRAATRRPFIVGIKIAAHEYTEGGLRLEDGQAIAAHLADTAPPDYIATGQGNFSPSLEKHVPDMHFGEKPYAHLPRAIREVSQGVPVIAISGITSLDTADELLNDGTADMVGMTRALLADAHLVRKTAAGKEPRPCILCNVCWEYIHTGRAVACVYGPETSRESELPEPAKSTQPLEVHVIGGGPAGLEFARTAVDYGHDVHLHEASEQLGGRLRREASVPGREIYTRAAEWLEGEVRAGGATITLNDRVEPGAVQSADLIVRATGAVAQVDELPGAATVMSLEELVDRPAHAAESILIVDELEAEPVYDMAWHLAEEGHAVTLMTRRASIGRRVSYVSLIGVLRRLDEAGVTVLTLAVPRRIEDGELIVAHALSGREYAGGRINTVVRAGPYVATQSAGESASLVVGDASSPRELLAVVREANAAAHQAFGPKGD